MFTDGLDTSALQWVRKEQALRTCSTPASGKGSPDITRYTPRRGSLPPPQLSNVHLHSHVVPLRPPSPQESVGSISGHHHHPRRSNGYDDYYDSGDEHESTRYSPSDDTSPSTGAAAPRLPDHAEVEDYYDGPLSRKNSSKESSLLRRDLSGRRDSSGRKDGSLSRKNSFDLRGTDRFDIPYYGRRDEAPVERHGAYTGSGRFDPDYGRAAHVKDVNSEDQHMSSATELSDDTVDTDEESEEDRRLQQLPQRRAPLAAKVHHAGAGYPKIELYEPIKREYRPAPKEVEDQPSVALRRPATTAMPMQSNRVNEPAPISTIAGPPSAPPFSDVPGAPEVPAPGGGGSSIGGSFVTSYEQRSTSPLPCEPSVRSVSTAEEPGITSHYRGSAAPPARAAPTPTRQASTPARAAATPARNAPTPPPLPPPFPVYHSGQAAWQALVAYDACVRLCLRAWSRGCREAPEFLLDECSLLRNCFGLQQILLQPHEEGNRKGVSEELADSVAAPKRSVGRVKIQVRKLKIMAKPQQSFRSSSLSAVDTNTVAADFEGSSRPHHKRSLLSSGWSAVRKFRLAPKQHGGSIRNGSNQNGGSSQLHSSQRSMAYVNAGAQYVRQVSGMLKDKVNSLRTSSLSEVPQDNFTCLVRLKSTPEQEALRLQPGSGETSIL